jgi:hypothetical protein
MNTFSIHLLLGLAVLGSGCASTSTPQNTRALKAQTTSNGGTSTYRIITIVPFAIGTDAQKAGAQFGENFAGDIVAQLRTDYGDVFEEVRWKTPKGQSGEVVVSGTIHKYVPGSAAARSILIGLGAASFQGEIVLNDGGDGRVLLTAPFDKLWAWGGMLGGSKTIDNMVAQSSMAIAKTLVRWKQGELVKD